MNRKEKQQALASGSQAAEVEWREMGTESEVPVPVPQTVSGAPAKLELPPLLISKDSVETVLRNAEMLTDLLRTKLVPGVDYAKDLVPGQNKPVLLDPGAQIIMAAFSVYPDHEIMERSFERERDKEIVRYVVKCRLRLRGYNVIVAEGVGSASSEEVKYKYRWLDKNTLIEDYGYTEEELEDLKKKVVRRGGEEVILYRVRNPELLDLDNTILKMAAKRAEIDAVLQLPGVSRVFTQDIGERKAERERKSPPSAFEAAAKSIKE